MIASQQQRAIEGLRSIAQLEEYVAAAVEESGYYGRLADALRSSAVKRRLAADRLAAQPPSSPQRLRLVG